MPAEPTRHTAQLTSVVKAAFPLTQVEEAPLILRGRLPYFSFSTHDYKTDQQGMIVLDSGSFVATLFLAAATSAHTYSYDSALHNGDSEEYVGAISQVKFVIYDVAGKPLLADTFHPGCADSEHELVSHHEQWSGSKGTKLGVYLQQFVSDRLVELLGKDGDALLWEGKSLSYCRDACPDFYASYFQQTSMQACVAQIKKVQDAKAGYFAYTHDFNGEHGEFHWALLGLIAESATSKARNN
jgi:hypothetical protein